MQGSVTILQGNNIHSSFERLLLIEITLPLVKAVFRLHSVPETDFPVGVFFFIFLSWRSSSGQAKKDRAWKNIQRDANHFCTNAHVSKLVFPRPWITNPLIFSFRIANPKERSGFFFLPIVAQTSK